MASHQLVIAKASLSACLLRPDPTSVSRDEINAFHASLDRVLSHCSPLNIQACKDLLLQYVASSSNRVSGLAKYLVVLAGSFDETLPVGTQPSSSAKRRRLHMLYLLHDLLHHTKYHMDGNAVFSTVSGSLQPFMVDLLGHAAAYDQQQHSKHYRRLNELLDNWSTSGYFSPELIQKLREVVRNGAAAGPTMSPLNDASVGEAHATTKQSGKDAPVIVPSAHGDSGMFRYDLPAGNLVPHVIPNSSIPVHVDNMKPLQFLAGPATSELVQTLKNFLKEGGPAATEELAKNEDFRDIINELALKVPQSEITRGRVGGAYFSWSPAFDQQIQDGVSDGSASRSRSPSPSRSEAWNEVKQERDSDNFLGRDGRRSGTSPWKQSRRDEREEYRGRSRSPRERSYTPPPPRFPPPVSGSWPGPPPPMPVMAFPPHPWAAPSAVPPLFPGPPPPMPMPPGQPLPGGQFHFPPPHLGNQQGNAWGVPPWRSQ